MSRKLLQLMGALLDEALRAEGVPASVLELAHACKRQLMEEHEAVAKAESFREASERGFHP